jgi:hypothetical protein
MRFFKTPVVVQFLAASLVAASPLNPAASPLIDIDPAAGPLDALVQLQQYAYATLKQNSALAKRTSSGCSLATASVRRDWQVYHNSFSGLTDLVKGAHVQSRQKSIHQGCAMSADEAFEVRPNVGSGSEDAL